MVRINLCVLSSISTCARTAANHCGSRKAPRPWTTFATSGGSVRASTPTPCFGAWSPCATASRTRGCSRVNVCDWCARKSVDAKTILVEYSIALKTSMWPEPTASTDLPPESWSKLLDHVLNHTMYNEALQSAPNIALLIKEPVHRRAFAWARAIPARGGAARILRAVVCGVGFGTELGRRWGRLSVRSGQLSVLQSIFGWL